MLLMGKRNLQELSKDFILLRAFFERGSRDGLLKEITCSSFA
jgi:hypothetical protein